MSKPLDAFPTFFRGDPRANRRSQRLVRTAEERLWIPRFALLPAGAAVLVALSSCTKPYAVASDYQDPDDPQRWRLVLTPAEQADVNAALYDWTDGRAATEAPKPAPYGIRWSDVPAAVPRAASMNDMAVFTASEHDWGWEYALITVDNYPGSLVVRRMDPPTMYEATATVGRFESHEDRAAALLRDLDKELRRLGAAPRYDNE